MDKQLKRDIAEWDIVNWMRAIDFWEKQGWDLGGKKVLELGSRNGGLSLYFALQGAQVVCSDLNGPTKNAIELHKKYGVEDKITYENINALEIPYENYFDIIADKSVLGGIACYNNLQNLETAVAQIYSALKPNGLYLPIENMAGAKIHKVLRNKFSPGAKYWKYFTIEEMLKATDRFSETEYKTFGFIGLFGMTNNLRSFLGHIDTLLCEIISEKSRYIGAFICRK